MNINILKKFLKRGSFDSGNLMVVYGFDKIEDNVVLNELYSQADHFPSFGCLNADVSPGILISCDDQNLFSAYQGCCSMGFFDKNTVVRIGSEVKLSEWNVFLNYNHNFPRKDRDKAEILFTSMEAPWSYSGFCVGINGSNRLFFEYAAGNKTKKTLILPKALENYEIISVSKSKTSIEFSSHDPFSRKNYNVSYEVSDMVDSDIWTLGNFRKTGDWVRYRGYHGFIDDFVLMKGSVSESQRGFLSKAFYWTGTRPSYTIEKGITVKTAQGAPVVTTYTSDTLEVTGYGLEPVSNIENVCGGSVVTCKQIPLSGYAQETSLEYPTVETATTSTETVPAKELYDEVFASRYAERNLVFLKDIDYKDTYEIYSYNSYNDDVSNTAEFIESRNAFFIKKEHAEKHINFFVNGMKQIEDEDFKINNISRGDDPPDYNIEEVSDVSIGYDNGDAAVYDVVNYKPYLFELKASTIASPNFSGYYFISDPKYTKKDIYFRGQKLLSGADFIDFKNGVLLSGLHSASYGIYSFNSKPESLGTVYTGEVGAYDRLSFNLRNEQIWLNGKRQIEGLDYTKTSDKSMLNNTVRLEKKAHKIYNNETGYFSSSENY